MKGIHEMGGLDGCGPVRREENGPVFHADWERRVFGIVNTAVSAAQGNIDEFRHAIERIPPGQYLASSYYERWLSAIETLLVERGLVTREELIDRHDESAEMLRAQIASGVRTSGPEPVKEKAGARLPRARFVKGDW